MEETTIQRFDDFEYAKKDSKKVAIPEDGGTRIHLTYEDRTVVLDLLTKNIEALEKVLEPWLLAGKEVTAKTAVSRRVATGPRTAADSDKPKYSPEQLGSIRDWANSSGGFTVSPRGAIKQEVKDAAVAAGVVPAL
jgi:hypothetical protein